MAGGRRRGGRRRGQVPNEEAPHRDCNVQDVMIGDLQRQVAELIQCLAAQDVSNREIENFDSDSTFNSPYHNPAPCREHRGWESHHRSFGFKVDMPKYSGALQAEGFINWLNELEHILEYKEVPDHEKVKLVAIKLKGRASVW
jgi:hypothetical protein